MQWFYALERNLHTERDGTRERIATAERPVAFTITRFVICALGVNRQVHVVKLEEVLTTEVNANALQRSLAHPCLRQGVTYSDVLTTQICHVAEGVCFKKLLSPCDHVLSKGRG